MDQRTDAKGFPEDPTPVVGAATDVAPLGHAEIKPPHERTADEDVDVVNWDHVAADCAFKALMAAKRRFIVPATAFFVVYYFALPALVGYAPRLMEKTVIGVVNIAYLFALSQFFVAWILAGLYVRAAGRFDQMARRIVEKVEEDRIGD